MLFVAIVAGIIIPLIIWANSENVPSFTLAISIGLCAYLAVVGLYALYVKEYIRTYFYDGGENFITIKKGVFAPAEIHVQYQKIQDVYVDQDILDRIMGLYDVHIASATVSSSIEAHIDGVNAEAAQGLKEFFLTKIQNASNGHTSGMNAVSATHATETAAVLNPHPVFTGEVSDTKYPIQPAWLTKSIISAVFSAVLFSLFITYGFLTDDFGVPFIPAFVGITVVYVFFSLIGVLLWKSNYHFKFMHEFIQFNTGILSKSEQHLPYKSIQDVNITQSFIDRIFGLSNVTIENAAQTSQTKGAKNSNIKIVGLKPEQAKALTEIIKNISLTKNSSQMGV